MPNIFVPAIDDSIELLADVIMPVSFVNNYENGEFLRFNFPEITDAVFYTKFWDENPQYQRDKWTDPVREEYLKWLNFNYNKQPFIFPAGTKLRLERYHVSHSGEERITAIIEDGPDKRMVPKKNGGAAKGKTRIYFHVGEFNALGEVVHYQKQ